MNFTSESSAETISRTPPTQIVQCIMRMPCISNISSFCVELGVLGLEPVQPLRCADFLDIEVFEEGLEMLVPFAHVRADECTDGFRAPGVDIAEQAALNLVVDGRSEEGRIQILLAECHERSACHPTQSFGRSRARPEGPFGPASCRHRQATSGRARRTPLIPLRNVVVVSRDRHRGDSFFIATPTTNSGKLKATARRAD